MPSASCSEDAGSVVTRSVECAAAASIANMAAHVVFPTPPLPPMNEYTRAPRVSARPAPVARLRAAGGPAEAQGAARARVQGSRRGVAARRSMFVAFERRLDAGDLHLLRRDRRGLAAALPRLDLADADDDVGFQVVELLLADLADLEAQLRHEQALAQDAVIVQLGLDRRRDLVEHEADARDDQAVDDEHVNVPVRASGGC